MSIDARVKAIIENRKNNFYDLFDEFKDEDVNYFDGYSEPKFDFEAGSDEEKIYNQKMARFKALSARIESNANIYYTDDESSDFFGYSYEEIIGMANNGTVIPDEVLSWAYSMAEKNPQGETTDTAEDTNDAQELYKALKQNPKLNIKTITRIFASKCIEQEDELEAYLDEIAPIEREMESARVEAETQRADALIKIKDLAKEWKDLKSKVEGGEELSAEEQARFEELKDEFGAEDKKYQKAIDSATKNFTKIGERLTFVTGKADTTFDFGEQTVEVAKELSEFEKTHKRTGIFGGMIAMGIAGVLGIDGFGGVKRFSEIATTIGTNTQFFAEDVNDVINEVQLLMDDVADTAKFDINDPSHKVEPLTNDPSIDVPELKTVTKPKGVGTEEVSSESEEEEPVEGEEVVEDATTEQPVEENVENPEGETETTEETDENSEPEEPVEEDPRTKEQQLIEEMNLQNEKLSQIKPVIKADGKTSTALGIENVKKTKELEPQIPQITEEAIAVARAKRDKEAEAKNNAGTASSELEAQGQTEQIAEGTQELEEDKKEKETIFDQYNNDFQQDKAKNAQFSQDIQNSNTESNTGLELGAQGSATGMERTNIGAGEIATGTMLLMNWMNPVSIMLGRKLIKLGKEDTALGGSLLGSGLALTVNSGVTMAVNSVASDSVAASNEKTDESAAIVKGFETDVNAAVEEQLEQDKEAEEAKETEQPDDKKAGKEEDKEVTPEDSGDAVGDAEDEQENAENENEKNEKIAKKTDKKLKKNDKKLKKTDKQAKKSDKEAKLEDKKGVQSGKQGEEEAKKSNTDEANGSAEKTTEDLAETAVISEEVTQLATEAEQEANDLQKASAEALSENQAIVTEMGIINNELQQDDAKLKDIENQIQQESNKLAEDNAQPAQQPQPQPVQQPKKAPKKQPQKPAEEKETPAEKAENAKIEADIKKAKKQSNAQAPKKAPAQTTQPETAPEGSDKIEYSSDKEKQPSFVGFVAQSDSLASGSALAGSNTTSTQPQENNNQGNGASIMALKNAQNKKKAAQKKQQNKTTSANPAGNTAPQQDEKQIITANRTTEKPFDINSMDGGNDKVQGLRQSAEALRAQAFHKQARLRDMYIRANNNAMQRIAEEARIQAENARKQRLAQEKQERIAKIKQYAGYVQGIGSLTTTAGMIVEKCGTAQVSAGTAQVTAGTSQMTAGLTQVTTGTVQVTTGTTMVTTGTAQVTAGTTQITTGTGQVTSGTSMISSGTTMISTGTPMLSNPFTAAAGAALVAGGTTMVVNGSSLVATGTAMIATGGTQIATGTSNIATGTSNIATGSANISSGSAQISAGSAQIITGTAQIASGTSLVATGATLQTIGTIVTAAGAATSAGADIANGNILGGIASIVGAAASVVGCAAPVSQLGNAAMQLGSQGIAVAGQLTTSGAGQDNGNQQQDQKKKKKFKQNARTQGIMDKAAQQKQAVGNRFNK